MYCSSLVAEDFAQNAAAPLFVAEDDLAFRNFLDQKAAERKQARKNTARPQKKTRKTKQRRANKTPQTEWLKELICPFVYGERTPVGVRPSITKESFVGRWNMGIGLPSLPNYRLLDHFNGLETLYFFGNGWKKAKRSLVMIDIDVLKARGLGSPEGARRFTRHLQSIWPGLYVEPSTNGLGMHGYLILWKKDADAARTNTALKRLEAWLRAEARKVNADIEQVEVKGACLDMTFSDGGLVQSVKYGFFGKLPRDAARFEEWQNTTMLRVRDLEGSQYDVVECGPPAVTPEPEAVVKLPVPAIPVRQKTGSVVGSVTGKVIGEDELAAITQFERLYREWAGPNDLMAGKFRVTAYDFAVAMVFLRHFKADPNVDGSLPTRRVGELWTALFKAGDVQRGWNHHRWKRIRDFLSARGHIDWSDHRYQYGVVAGGDGGQDVRGIACKWEITDDYDWTLERGASLPVLKAGEASFVDTEMRKLIPTQGRGENLRPTPFPLWAEREQKFWQSASAASETLFAA